MKNVKHQKNLTLTISNITKKNLHLKTDRSKILCIHCKRTIDNGISCIGKCVADNDY